MIFLEHPWQLLQGVAVLLLLLLYLWRRRSRRLKVAALFLWPEEHLSHSSGRSFRLLIPPLRFWLEALAILTLAVAAATPFLVRRSALPPLVVILDNSFSLQAKQANGQTVQSNLKTRLQRLLAQRHQRQLRFILAGAEPALLPPELSLQDVFEHWDCMAGEADLSTAIALAHQSVPGSQTLVCTDHTPTQSLSSDVGWECQGTPLDNLAIVNLRRSSTAILVEVGNFSSQDRQAELVCSLGTSQSLNLPANQTIHCRLPVAEDASNQTISVHLSHAGDALPLDDKGVLLPTSSRPLTCWLSPTLPPASRQALQRAFEANPDCLIISDAETSELRCGDSTLPTGAYHRLLWHTASRPVICTPLPGDTTHHLQQGLSWKNIFWPAQPDTKLSGEVLLWGDGFPLFTLVERGIWRDFHWNLAAGGGQLPNHPQWPSMLWNMTSFLSEQRPGPDRNNYSCGERVTLRLPSTEDTAVLRINKKPAQTIRLAQPGGLAVTAPLEAGVLTIASGKHQWTASINPTSATESDLRHAQTSSLAAKPSTSSSRKLLSPLCFLLALLLLAIIPRIS